MEIDWSFDSVPYALIHTRVEIRATATTVDAAGVWFHVRSYVSGRRTTIPDHMPTHTAHLTWGAPLA